MVFLFFFTGNSPLLWETFLFLSTSQNGVGVWNWDNTKTNQTSPTEKGAKKKTTKNSVTGRFSAYGYAIPGIPGRKDCGTFSIRFAGRPM